MAKTIPTPVRATDGYDRVQFTPAPMASTAVDIAFARRAPAHAAPLPAVSLDLSGRPSIVLLIGRGGTGKTTLARWLLEHSTSPTLAVALDPVNRTLANYVNRVSQPDTSDPIQSARWLADFLSFALAGKHPAVIDFGGGDTTLGKLLEDVPDLAEMVEAAGMSLVAFYTLAPRVDDLAPFLSLDFRPAATAFVLNDIGDPSRNPTHAFEPILSQPAVRDAIQGGAQVVWMPRLDSDVVSLIETHRTAFKDAAAGGSAAGPFQAAQVRTWLRRMHAAFQGVQSWLV